MPDRLVLTRPGDDDSLPVVVLVSPEDGIATPGPFVSIEVGTFVEMDLAEFEWLLEQAGPKALERLRALTNDTKEIVMAEQADPTLARAEQVLAAGTPVADLTGVELLALFEGKARRIVSDPDADGATAKRAAAMAITYGQEARQRYTEALAHLRGTHNPVDLEALDRAGVSAEEERARFEDESRGA